MKNSNLSFEKHSSSHDITPSDFNKSAQQSINWISQYLENMNNFPVLSKSKPGEVKAQLPLHPPENSEDFEKIFSDFENIIIPGITHWNHPRFFAYFSVTGSYAGIIGEMLSAALNVNGMLWKTSPSATELEEVVLDWVRQMLGLPEEFDGIIHDTASVGVMCAVAAAREYAGLEIREKGMAGRRDLPSIAVYTSNQAHSSIEKGAIILGIGQQYVRKITCNEKFEMKADVLEEQIKADIKAGIKPICVIATVGTTSTTSIDPISEVVVLCKKYNIWLHVDAAYGGSAAVLPEIRSKFADWDQADSIIVNPHKWMFTPIDCSILYCKRPQVLKGAFSLVPEYLRTGEDNQVKNYMDYGVALGRRFRALKLWMVIRSLGTEKIKGVIKQHIFYAQKLEAEINNHPDFEMLAPVPFSTLVFRYNRNKEETLINDFNEKLLDSINVTGDVFLSHTKLNGKYGIRLAIGNIKTSWDDVELAWKIIQEKAKEMV
jgi:aromatic-L-amino-acid/L-tryptophan decarboxylase